jgi:hypothetical protein
MFAYDIQESTALRLRIAIAVLGAGGECCVCGVVHLEAGACCEGLVCD